jgi:hypothetical protein
MSKSGGYLEVFLKGQYSHDFDLVSGNKGPVKGLCASGP